jgi:hypothetical protein
MPLKKDYVRDGRNRIVGSKTSGYSDRSELVRDSDNQIAGRTSGTFNTTRDRDGSIVSVNSSDPGLLIRRKK